MAYVGEKEPGPRGFPPLTAPALGASSDTSAIERIRTSTGRSLKPLTLPLVYDGVKLCGRRTECARCWGHVVDPEGIEPSSLRCERRIFPLDNGPMSTDGGVRTHNLLGLSQTPLPGIGLHRHVRNRVARRVTTGNRTQDQEIHRLLCVPLHHSHHMDDLS